MSVPIPPLLLRRLRILDYPPAVFILQQQAGVTTPEPRTFDYSKLTSPDVQHLFVFLECSKICLRDPKDRPKYSLPSWLDFLEQYLKDLQYPKHEIAKLGFAPSVSKAQAERVTPAQVLHLLLFLSNEAIQLSFEDYQSQLLSVSRTQISFLHQQKSSNLWQRLASTAVLSSAAPTSSASPSTEEEGALEEVEQVSTAILDVMSARSDLSPDLDKFFEFRIPTDDSPSVETALNNLEAALNIKDISIAMASASASLSAEQQFHRQSLKARLLVILRTLRHRIAQATFIEQSLEVARPVQNTTQFNNERYTVNNFLSTAFQAPIPNIDQFIKSFTIDQSSGLLNQFESGFPPLPNTQLDRAVRVLRILFLFELRRAQSLSNELVVSGQEFCSDPKTDVSLGLVGR